MAKDETLPEAPASPISKSIPVEEVERANDIDRAKSAGDPFTPEEEKRFVRKIDLW